MKCNPGLELILQIVEEALVMCCDDSLETTKLRGNEASDVAPMISVIGRDDVVKRDNRCRAVELPNCRQS